MKGCVTSDQGKIRFWNTYVSTVVHSVSGNGSKLRKSEFLAIEIMNRPSHRPNVSNSLATMLAKFSGSGD